jgi:hypothetical protein
MVNEEREASTGLHDIDAIELTSQCALEIGATIILAADKCDDPVSVADSLHASRAGGDEHLSSWGRLLTGLSIFYERANKSEGRLCLLGFEGCRLGESPYPHMFSINSC